MKKKLQKILGKVISFTIFILLMAKKAIASGMSESSLKTAASKSFDDFFTVLAAGLIVAGVGLGIFGGYNLSLTFTEGGSGNSSQKAAGGFAAAFILIALGLFVILSIKPNIKTGLGLGG